MKTKFSIFSQPNYLTRTAIEAECAVPILVCFYILCNNKNYKKASEGLSDIEAMKHADSVANEYLNKTLEDNEL